MTALYPQKDYKDYKAGTYAQNAFESISPKCLIANI